MNAKNPTFKKFQSDDSRKLNDAIKNSIPGPFGRTRQVDPDGPTIKPFKGYHPTKGV